MGEEAVRLLRPGPWGARRAQATTPCVTLHGHFPCPPPERDLRGTQRASGGRHLRNHHSVCTPGASGSGGHRHADEVPADTWHAPPPSIPQTCLTQHRPRQGLAQS